MKSVAFIASSLDDLRSLPLAVRREAGYQLDRVQQGLMPDDFKPMPGIGKSVMEIRIWDEAGTFRVIYVAKLAQTVFVLHCFQKKTQRTAKRDLDLAAIRYKELIQEMGS